MATIYLLSTEALVFDIRDILRKRIGGVCDIIDVQNMIDYELGQMVYGDYWQSMLQCPYYTLQRDYQLTTDEAERLQKTLSHGLQELLGNCVMQLNPNHRYDYRLHCDVHNIPDITFYDYGAMNTAMSDVSKSHFIIPIPYTNVKHAYWLRKKNIQSIEVCAHAIQAWLYCLSTHDDIRAVIYEWLEENPPIAILHNDHDTLSNEFEILYQITLAFYLAMSHHLTEIATHITQPSTAYIDRYDDETLIIHYQSQ